MERQPAVYLRTNRKRNALYLGVTNNLFRRDWEHRNGKGGGFSTRYNMTVLVWYKQFVTMPEAIAEEKRLKGASRADKLALIEAMNPEWQDLGSGWHDAPTYPIASSVQHNAISQHFNSSQ
jgi:putative endonuclease